MKTKAIAVFDIGKTNRKFVVFDSRGELLHVVTALNPPSGDPGYLDDLHRWMDATLDEALHFPQFQLEGLNFTTHGAAMVLADAHFAPLAPLTDYLAPYLEPLRSAFAERYNANATLELSARCPIEGHLNAGLQLYHLVHECPGLMPHARHALHLPQYLSARYTGTAAGDFTSTGCHTLLWNFDARAPQAWLGSEGLLHLLPEPAPPSHSSKVQRRGKQIMIGKGMHDSSAALLAYQYEPPYTFIATGTWWVVMHPLNQKHFEPTDLHNGLMCYLDPYGQPVTSWRMPGGRIHDVALKALASVFNLPQQAAEQVTYTALMPGRAVALPQNETDFSAWCLQHAFHSFDEAYAALITSLVAQLAAGIRLAEGGNEARRLYVEGGITANISWMNALSAAFPHKAVMAVEHSHAPARGAVMAMGSGPVVTMSKQSNKRIASGHD